MSYLMGTGTAADPWVIHNPTALKYYFEAGGLVNGYAVLACDIDMSGVPVTAPYEKSWFCLLDGYGHAISNLNVSGSVTYLKTTWKRIRFITLTATTNFLYGYNNSYSFITDCEFNGVAMPAHISYIVFTRCVARNLSATITNYFNATNCQTVDGNYLFSRFTDVRALTDRYAASTYPALAALPSLWAIDGSSMPRLIAQATEAFTQAYAVKGNTKVGGVAKSRIVGGHSPVDFHQFAKIISDPDDGSYLLNCGWYADHVAVVHRDDYGKPFVASQAYALGARIHPAIPNGYAYECTSAGTSDSAAPSDWPTTGTLTSGTAIFTPKPIYAPETLLVVPRLINLLTGEPVEV